MYSKKKIGFLEAYSIGVGGMVGGGIFAVLGLTITLAGGAAPLSFLLAGLIALLTTYSYIKLSLRYPSEGGTIEFIVQAFGNTIFAGWVNTLLMVSYVIMLALYAYAFGSGDHAFCRDQSTWCVVERARGRYHGLYQASYFDHLQHNLLFYDRSFEIGTGALEISISDLYGRVDHLFGI
jgi:amino acid transporter